MEEIVNKEQEKKQEIVDLSLKYSNGAKSIRIMLNGDELKRLKAMYGFFENELNGEKEKEKIESLIKNALEFYFQEYFKKELFNTNHSKKSPSSIW